MPLAHSSHVPFEEYLKLREESEQILEYIDGVICMSPSPSIKHQLVSSNLHTGVASGKCGFTTLIRFYQVFPIL